MNGFIVMDEELEDICQSILFLKVPNLWKDCFLSLKPLMYWIVELNDRVAFFREWFQKGTPLCFWLPAFSFPQAFITAIL